MDQWTSKLAVVTGASGGIGSKVVEDLLKSGVLVAGIDRDEVKLQNQKETLGDKFHPFACNLLLEEDIVRVFSEINERFDGVDVLVNCAGMCANSTILGGDYNAELFHDIMQTNFLSVVSCIEKAYKSMVDRDVYGYIVIVSSLLGHVVPRIEMKRPIFNLYPSSKYALTALNNVLRDELNTYKNFKVRVSNISPGKVETPLQATNGLGEKDWVTPCPKELQPEDVSRAILFILASPPHVQIQDMIIKPVCDEI